MPKVTIAQNILAANDTIAQEIQRSLVVCGIRTINIMSSPGAGKTTLLERTIERLRGQLGIGVIEGDVETSADAERIEAAGAETVRTPTRCWFRMRSPASRMLSSPARAPSRKARPSTVNSMPRCRRRNSRVPR